MQTDGIRLYNSIYAVYLMDWLKIIKKKNLLIIRTEDLSHDIAEALRVIFKFLDVSELDTETLDEIASLPRRNVRTDQQPMSYATKKLLVQFFQPYNEMLARVLKHKKFLWDEFH